MQQISHLIDGKTVAGKSGNSSAVYNPATGEQTGTLDLASVEEVDQAVASSQKAFEDWQTVSVAQRTKLLYNFRNLVEANAEEIASRLTAEHGKVNSDAQGEVARGLENIEFACGVADALKGTYTEHASTGVDVYSVRQPLGVCAGITPFNFPAMVPLWMFPNAVACGNTFVLKPSERDPSAPRFIVELAQEAGFPPGVVNLINGDKVAVDRLLEHSDVKAISFVGSTPIAKYVYATGAAHGKRVQALGGAKNHMIVLPDADVDLAADAAVSAAYGSAGERCMAISVVVAVGDVADDLVAAIQKRIPDLNIGPGDNPDSEMGPLITEEHRDRVAGYIETGSTEGATVVVDGREQEFTGEGFFLGASLIDGVTTDMTVYRDEIFGPVLSVVRVDTYAEGVKMISDNGFGNGAAIFTRDGGAARQFQQDADAGMVGINVPIPVPVGYHSFGGWKDSLFGDTTMYGPEGLRFYTRPKVVTSRWPDPSTSSVNLGFPQND
ncbi:MAG: CoA-acylating methylmalonate-semialdehyde dehydrogenase [Actinomycetota bacterium]|jgi:malonate-semialdehyde dehydrogenase (acetylating)/methylmalonate-semialdehyde dehydrogenase|nr:methylmalonate-semialdehyde dehydrogenase (CoA acylating) [Acidimicrobiaceae bacterium]MBO31172.1 methylmalonate-semialdehyde dehydrogenase (CoA acylating) [Acidimicrobiaceae bacterium]MEC9035060.1 CoA-acylating methylmalonate-semialdehyde dehydrogenase [Actinomycetota bacterium]MEE2646812.1 CoA-acylating methylmalonate-semialdehyde dehydrogenase [Actinomycetota bacterium]|tara:strand:+ start:2939 stop:4426 length:1488 start_codon:yes stop_codon:yes gene_type:complete